MVARVASSADCVCAWRLCPRKHDLAVGRQFLHELRRFLEHLERLLQVDDVDPVALSEDVFLILGFQRFVCAPK